MSNENLIDQQIERLPVKIGEFIRRFACLPDGSCVVQYTKKGFYLSGTDQDPSEVLDNDMLYSEEGENVEDVVEKILVKIELHQRLARVGKLSAPFVYVDQELIDQGVTRISLIRPTCTATMMAPCTPLPPSYSHIYFLVQAEEYLLAFGRKGNRYFFRRNDVCVSLPIPPLRVIKAQEMAIAVVWRLDEIGITGYLASNKRKRARPKWAARSRDWKETVPTVPPNSLYVWARKRLLISERNYARPGQVFNVVIDALQALNEDISMTSDLAGFWDEQRDGNKVVKLIPKREPIITRHIESRLRDITLQKNIDIMREVEIGNSKLDLLFSAPLADGNTVKVCVEVKKAYAGDLAHGLSIQLPEYMRRLGTDYGVYCVIHFGENYQHQVEPFKDLVNSPSFESNIELYRSNLGTLLNVSLSGLPFRNLVATIIDVSRKPPASQM
jgi:hypothetical protein